MTAAWETMQQRASFRGVGFKFRTTGGQFGRRLVVHLSPGVDQPQVEDLGRKVRQYQIEGWVIGGNYFADRDALIAALDTEGSGTLVHPYLKGVSTVFVQDWVLSETTDEGGMARFSMTFIDGAPVTYPLVTQDTQAQVQTAATATLAAASSDFGGAYNVSAYTDVAEAVAQVQAIQTQVAIYSAQAVTVGGQVAAIEAVIENPDLIVNYLQGLIDPSQGFAQLLALAGFTSGASASSAASAANKQALTSLSQVQAVTAACQLSAQTTYTSYTDATNQLNAILDAIDALSNTVDDDSFVALQDLRAATAADVQARAADLAVITTITLQESMPAVVLAQRLYGAANCLAAEADILSRNSVVHPAFLPSGVPLEVLSSWAS